MDSTNYKQCNSCRNQTPYSFCTKCNILNSIIYKAYMIQKSSLFSWQQSEEAGSPSKKQQPLTFALPLHSPASKICPRMTSAILRKMEYWVPQWKKCLEYWSLSSSVSSMMVDPPNMSKPDFILTDFVFCKCRLSILHNIYVHTCAGIILFSKCVKQHN